MDEKEKNEGAGMSRKEKNAIKQRFSAKRVAMTALFVALSYLVSFLELPLFPAAGFLKLDFGNVFILLIGFLLGPVEGVITCVLKEGLRAIGSGSGGVGEIANMLVTSAYILFPTILYRYKKGIGAVAASLGAACVIGTLVALPVNRFINFPLYMGDGAAAAFASLWGYILAFNLIKTVSVAVLTVILYKRLSYLLKKMKI
ncbi:MAG: ECF transporter S component [Clostridia bacterium]|nr:ECF transporter S component [Clostridia bacterium]